MSFWKTLGQALNFKSLDTIDGIPPAKRLKLFLKKEKDPADREFLAAANKLVFESTEPVIGKLSILRRRHDAIGRQPLLWIGAILALYDQGHPVFDEELGQQIRNAFANAKKMLAEHPDEKKSKLFRALQKDIETRKLMSLAFLAEPSKQPQAALPPVTHAMSEKPENKKDPAPSAPL